MNLKAALESMLYIDLANWRGLPGAIAEQFDELFGEPYEREETMLGCFPATRLDYAVNYPAQMLSVWVRDGIAVMVEIQKKPDISILGVLAEPSAVLPNEIILPDAYPHEYLYCDIGLILTVAQPYDVRENKYIARCRGVKKLANAREFGPTYYQAFDEQVRWQPLEPEGA